MPSSFPWKDEKHMYKPAMQNTPRYWLNRVTKTCKARPRVILAIVVSILFFVYFYFAEEKKEVVSRYTPVVLVMVVHRTDAAGEQMRILDKILENRHEYAIAHDYEVAVFNASEYSARYTQTEQTWIKLAALRDAMGLYPHAEWFWYLDQNAIIMNPTIPLHSHFLSPASLLALPLRDVPVFPPETTIRTLSLKNQPPSQIALLLTHGGGILHTGTVIVKRGDYAKFVLDSWNDPLVRSYGFPGEENQAFEHLIQWHSSLLEGLAIMPKRSLLSFSVAAGDDEQYHEGDFVVHLDGCEGKGRNCEKEFMRYWAQRGSLTVENELEPPKPNKIVKDAAGAAAAAAAAAAV